MSGYRRFVAYVYEYRKGKKENNCGFVKVEVRDARCTMEIHLQCAGLSPGVECRTYGFVRKDGLLNGILLGSCKTGEDSIECVIDTDVRSMGGFGNSLEQMGGMIFMTELGGFFGTEWDDEPIRPDNFREIRAEKQEELKEQKELEAKVQKETPADGAEVETAEVHMPEEAVFPVQEQEMWSPVPSQPPKEPEGPVTSTPSRPPQPPKEPERPVPSTPSRPSQPPKEPERPVPSQPPVPGRPSRPQPSRPSVPPPVGEPYMPFEDEEFAECRKIQPKDLACFSRRSCALRQNRFLLYGFYNFGHLLLCRKSNGQLMLGVPGAYDQQERFMANMFGFPYFKESRSIELPNGRGGYWYRLIDTPDFHDRNRS